MWLEEKPLYHILYKIIVHEYQEIQINLQNVQHNTIFWSPAGRKLDGVGPIDNRPSTN